MSVSNIIDNINVVAETIYRSIEDQVFKVLDELLIIKVDILKQEPIKNIFVENKSNGIILMAGCFVTFFLTYFAFTKIISMYNGKEIENTWAFILRIIICTIAMSSSLYLCEQVLNINEMLTNIVLSVGKDVTNKQICFESLKETITNLEKHMSSSFLSIDGMIKGLISYGSITLVLNFSIRYVTIIFLILISPIAFMLAIHDITFGVFKSWGKLLISNLLMQQVVLFLLVIPLSFKERDTIIFKIVIVGTIYILYRLNNLTRELFNNFYSQTSKSLKG